jgi:hypothetical protein
MQSLDDQQEIPPQARSVGSGIAAADQVLPLSVVSASTPPALECTSAKHALVEVQVIALLTLMPFAPLGRLSEFQVVPPSVVANTPTKFPPTGIGARA